MKFRSLGFGVALFLGLPAFAAEFDRDRSFGNDELPHTLTVGGGISAPSVNSALGENPAGLVYNTRMKALGVLATGSDDFNPMGYGGLFFYGNGTVGAGIGLQAFNNQMGPGGSILLLNWGLAAYLDALNMAFGFTGTYTLHREGSVTGTGAGTTWCVDTGLLFNPRGRFRYGFTLFQVLNEVDAIGMGVAYDTGTFATFVLDGTYNPKQGTIGLGPGLKIHLYNFQISSGYGFRVLGDDWTWIRQGLQLGVGFNLGNHIQLQAYYNQLARYYLGLMIRI